MAKPKIKVKDFLLQKGEYVALGVAGVALVVLLGWGVMTWSSAKPPEENINRSRSAANAVHAAINDTNLPPEEKARLDAELKLSTWKSLEVQSTYPIVPPEDFALAGNYFDPIGRPDTKWEIPQVLGIREFQVDLVRAPMKGYDIIYDQNGKAQIAVLDKKQVKMPEEEKLKAAREALKKKAAAGGNRFAQNQQNPPQPAPMQPPKGPGLQGPGFPGPGGLQASGEGGQGFGGGQFDQGAVRTETTIKYVAIDNLDDEMAEGRLPAMTVIPLRMVVVNASFPLKDQEEAVRRALRMPPNVDVSGAVQFDGFNVKRKVTSPTGRVVTTSSTFFDADGKPVTKNPEDGWVEYNYEDMYIQLIHSRKLGDHFDVDPKEPDTQYLPYFLDRSYAEAMALPFPELIPELGKYPKLRLPSIQKNIEALKKANTPKQTASELRNRIEGRKGGRSLYQPQTGGQTGGALIPGANLGGPGPEGPAPKGGAAISGPGAPRNFNPLAPTGPGGTAAENAEPPVTIDHLLLRFVDCDVKPGYTYEYQVQVRMKNPIWGKQYEDRLVNRALATDPKLEYLSGPWVNLDKKLTVPNESFVYAYDSAEYNKKIESAYPVVLPQNQDNFASNTVNRKIQERMKARDNPRDKQAVVQVLTWMEQVRTESNSAREPVGAWVVAEMPVGRGEYVGRKTYVKLPLWSSTQTAYTFREIQNVAAFNPKDKKDVAGAVPQGWLIDFTADRSILVDFEGGKVRTVAGRNPSVEDEVATEMLIVRSDGMLSVRNSAVDAEDPLRKQYTADWDKWLTEVAKSKAASTETGTGFERPKP